MGVFLMKTNVSVSWCRGITILGNYETTGKMKEMEEKLAEMNFCRGNKGYLINLQHVERIQDVYKRQIYGRIRNFMRILLSSCIPVF